MKAAALLSRLEPIVVGRILLYADDLVAGWMEQQTGQRIIPPYTAFATLAADGQISGAVLFNDHIEGSVEVSIVAPGRVSRALLRAAAQYAFGDLGVNRVTARTRASTLRAAHYADGEDAILYGMLKAECRW
jgi:hypothetical protein